MAMLLPCTIFHTYHLPQLHLVTSSNHGNAPSQHHLPHSPSTAATSPDLQQPWQCSFPAPSTAATSPDLQQPWQCSFPALSSTLTIYRNSISLPPATMEMLLPCTIIHTHHLPQLHLVTSSNHGNAPSLHYLPHLPSTATPSRDFQQPWQAPS